MASAGRDRSIVIRGAREHNLQDFDLAIPRGRLTVITGVSGSGKSSLAFDTLFREGQRRFLELMPSYARQFAGGLRRPDVDSIGGLGPAIAVSQRASHANPRSTVGTLTEVWDLLRLLYARLGNAPSGAKLTRGLFAFNGGEGACPICQGLGLEDLLDLDLLIADPAKTLRQGALKVSTPNGYLMYSQVTLPVLDSVLHVHGGSVDIPWQELTDEVRHVVYYGSERLQVPFGKHPLENRLKWTGITARPRQDGYYRGLVPVMEEILRGKRNDSILRFVRTGPCRACGGTRLGPEARAVRWQGRAITDLAAFTARELGNFLEGAEDAHPVFLAIRADLLARCALMEELGVGYLAFDRGAPTLSRGESQRLCLLTLALGELRGLLVVLDEPSAGLHSRDIERLLAVLRRLRDHGQTVVVVDHDPQLALSADWLVDLGPGPGRAGGRLLWSGPPAELLAADGPDTPTRRWLTGEPAVRTSRTTFRLEQSHLILEGLSRHNVANAALSIQVGGINLITGVSGAGKTSLLDAAVARLRTEGSFRRIVTVDADPIGRTPRSNPATYTGAFDPLRDLFAATPEAKALGMGKGHFSFNTAGGRCEACEGAGVLEVGMRYLGAVDLVCDTCGGRRFHPDVLSVKVGGLSIADVLEGSIQEAAVRFRGHPKLTRILTALADLGLGYLPLGRPATTLSGGEAQRVKLATELAKATSPALIALDEPSTGLHAVDVAVLLAAFDRLCGEGHTLLVVDHDLDLVCAADRITELGPGSGPEGGCVVVAGTPEEIEACADAPTGAALRDRSRSRSAALPDRSRSPSAALRDRSGPEQEALRDELCPRPCDAPMPGIDAPLELLGVTTHNLRRIDVAIPAAGLTVVTGPSGSGKSSLVFDTLLAESQARFADLVSPWARRLLPRRGGAELVSARGLQAAVAVPAQAGRRNPRATVGTATEVDELLRLLFARGGTRRCPACDREAVGAACGCGATIEPMWAVDFSPHSERGACPTCRGLGFTQICDPIRLVTRPDRPLDGGALDGTRFGAYLGEPDGRHIATLRAAAAVLGLDVSGPWRGMSPAAHDLAMCGAGDRVFEVAWEYRRGKRTGIHRFTALWVGLTNLVETEYERIHADARGEELEALLVDRPCETCAGERLKAVSRAVSFAGLRAPQAGRRDADGLVAWLGGVEEPEERAGLAGRGERDRRGELDDQGELDRRAGLDERGGRERRLEGDDVAKISSRRLALTRPIREELLRRLQALCDAGLGYLAPARELATLSGGEAQRVRLAAALGGGLVGATYVLDEPTQGLHPRDTARLVGVLKGLAAAGNAVVVVEHDADLVGAADHILELGPGSGPEGGLLVASGPPNTLRKDPSTYTARLLQHAVPASPRTSRPLRPFVPGVTVGGAFRHTLQDLDLTFPMGSLVAVAGVSGSGKSTLVMEVLAPSLRAVLRGQAPVGCRTLECHTTISDVFCSDQDGLSLAGASTVATLMGVAEALRKRFAATSEARARGLSAKAFSSSSPGGRCEICEGRGIITVAMDLLPDVTVGCEICGGRRFSEEVLACRWEGRSITDVLDAPLREANAWFTNDRDLAAPLRALAEIGLGYLRLGQEGTTLSAGERQRLRLARLLMEPPAAPVALLLDEPTRGLGFEDVDRLLRALHQLADAGHLVVVVEHHADFLAAADWVVELGPEGSAGGGRIVRAGPVPRTMTHG
jgi:excinuclease ABC subunit A